MRYYMDAMLDRDPEGTEVIGGVMKWELEGNWKLAAEQFATDWYHVNMSHASALMVMSPTGKGPKAEIVATPGRQFLSPNGHGAGFPTHPESRFDAQAVHEHYDYDALRERLGDAAVEGPMTTGHATVFPHFPTCRSTARIRVWHPKGPNKIEVWAWILVDKSMPGGRQGRPASLQPAHLRSLRHLRGRRRRKLVGDPGHLRWLRHQLGAAELPDGHRLGARGRGLPRARPASCYSDAAGRGFYRRWAELMNTPAWHERPAPAPAGEWPDTAALPPPTRIFSRRTP